MKIKVGQAFQVVGCEKDNKVIVLKEDLGDLLLL